MAKGQIPENAYPVEDRWVPGPGGVARRDGGLAARADPGGRAPRTFNVPWTEGRAPGDPDPRDVLRAQSVRPV